MTDIGLIVEHTYRASINAHKALSISLCVWNRNTDIAFYRRSISAYTRESLVISLFASQYRLLALALLAYWVLFLT